MIFLQNRFTDDYGFITKEIRDETLEFMKTHPIFLFLPATYEDATNEEVMGNILRIIKKMQTKYSCFERIILGLDRADTKKKFLKVKKLFNIPRGGVLWMDSPEMKKLMKKMSKQNKMLLVTGKGRNMWAALGYRFAACRTSSFVIHDCDIRPEIYDENIILSLVAPLIHPSFEERDFCKAYYMRLTTNDGIQEMSGRVTRLLVAPLIDALKENYGFIEKAMLDYVDLLKSFKYPLSGEFAMRSNVADVLRIQPDWGLEISTLNFLYQKRYRIAQVNLGIYDHKHSPEGFGDPKSGLNRMAEEIVKTIFRKMYSISGDKVIDDKRFDMLLYDYLKFAKHSVHSYRRLSKNKGWNYDQIKEYKRIELYLDAIKRAYAKFKTQPMELASLPRWDSLKNIYMQVLVDIVNKYNPEFKDTKGF